MKIAKDDFTTIFLDDFAESLIDDGFSPEEAQDMAYYALDKQITNKEELIEKWFKEGKEEVEHDRACNETDRGAIADLNSFNIYQG